jgi:serine/threonine protein kinase
MKKEDAKEVRAEEHKLNNTIENATATTTTTTAAIEYKKYERPEPLTKRMNFSISDFVNIRNLGIGSYSEVRMVKFAITEKDKRYEKIEKSFRDGAIALKVMDKKFIERENKMMQVSAERDVLNKADFRGITRLLFTFQDYYSLYIALECCDEGDLAMLVKRTKNGRLSSEQCAFYAKEVVEALRYCHDTLLVAHRDVKPENILLSRDGHVKLCDFGSCIDLSLVGKEIELKKKVLNESTGEIEERIHKKERGHSFVGSAEYCAPEILQGKAKASYACDIWSLGLTVYKLLAGKNPFRRATEYLTMQAIEKEPELLTYETAILVVEEEEEDLEGENSVETVRFDKKSEDFCRHCIAYDWNERPTCEKLLEFAFFEGLPNGEDELWSAKAPDFAPLEIEKTPSSSSEESEEDDDDDDGYYESAEWKAKVAAALQKKIEKVALE